MSRNKCCVPGCQVIKDDGVPLHRFPDPKINPDRYWIWISTIGGLHLQDMKYVYNNLRVCRKHFKAAYLYPNHKLCKLAIPELQISDIPLAQQGIPANLPSTSSLQRNPIRVHSVPVTRPRLHQNSTEMGAMPEECTQTADIILFFDKLFDSLNCGSYEVVPGKPLKSAVKANSAHHELWSASLPVLKSMKFDSVRNMPPLKGWVKTIENIRKLVKFLHEKGMKAILLRRCNQDALENFFGAIRAHGYANIMPNCSSFEASYKTLLLNNLTSKHSVGANCEADNDYCLDSLKFFLLEDDMQITNEGASMSWTMSTCT